MTVKVTLHIFSGRPDPTWELSEEQAQELIKKMGKIEKKIPFESLEHYSGLGYRGFTISSVDEKRLGSNRIGIYKGSINLTHSDFNLSDDNFDLEQWLLSTAEDQITEKIKQFVDKELSDKKKLIYSEEPIIKIAPPYEPGKWNNDPYICNNNNCYNYANNKATDTFAQPGKGGGQMYSFVQCGEVSLAAQRDGQMVVSSPSGSPGNGHFIALVIWPEEDYHWYRLDNNNYWSHKPGSTAARDKDNSGNRIADPRNCNRGPYVDFCGFYKCVPSNVHIN